MAREMNDEEDANHTKNAVGPVKWMAPEQMQQRASTSFFAAEWKYENAKFTVFLRLRQ